MRKTFPLEVPNLQPPRVVESIKSEVRRYLKRERRKTLPEDADYWDFDCRCGQESASSSETHISAINAGIDTASSEGWSAIYIEILAKPGYRKRSAEK